MRGRDIGALILLIVVAVASQLFRGGSAPQPETPFENPRRPTPEYRSDNPWDDATQSWLRDAPSKSPNKSSPFAAMPREAVIDVPNERRSGTGTAFAVAPGVWLTARHVIDGCNDIGVQIEHRKAMKVTDVRMHPNADVALLRTRPGPDVFPIRPKTGVNTDGFMVGFPAGDPGAVHARKIGETVLREKGRYKTREQADVWAERSRIPDRFGSLGGLSGGPVFDDRGHIIGAVLAEEPRRGRVFAAQPATLQGLLKDVSGLANADPALTFNASTYAQTARGVILDLRVSRVLCRVR